MQTWIVPQHAELSPMDENRAATPLQHTMQEWRCFRNAGDIRETVHRFVSLTPEFERKAESRKCDLIKTKSRARQKIQ
jgi:hypothetical protein